jgi:hypothetical protein
MQSEYFDMEITLLRPGKSVVVDSDRESVVPFDSVDSYTPDKIQAELFKITYDSLIREWTSWEKTQELLTKLTYNENYEVGAAKVIGVTIKPPYDGEYPLRNPSLLDRIFSVGPVDNPGMIENNDLSWEEKR